MAVDLTAMIARVEECTELRTSLMELLNGIVGVLRASGDADAVASAVQANAKPLADAVTVRTSHIAVVPNDPLVVEARTFLELPMKDRDAHVTSLRLAREQPRLDLAAHVATVQADLDAKTAELRVINDNLTAVAASLGDRLVELEAARTEVAAKALAIDDLQAVVDAKNATIAANAAQIEATRAQLDAATAQLEASRPEVVDVAEAAASPK